ncbi:tyrosine-type recombinase/integrase [Micromonospora humida]
MTRSSPDGPLPPFVVQALTEHHHSGPAFDRAAVPRPTHAYATWLASDGVPVNDVATVMGHEQTSTTPSRYPHSTGGT